MLEDITAPSAHPFNRADHVGSKDRSSLCTMKLSKSFLAFVLCLAFCVQFATAQTATPATVPTSARVTNPVTSTDAIDLLPESDIVVDMQIGRLLGEVTPRLLAGAPKQRAELEKMLALVKERTGFDVRSIDRVLVGMPVPPNLYKDFAAGKVAKMHDALVIVQGRFDADALASAGGLFFSAARDQHAGRTFFTFRLDPSHMKRLGVPEASIPGAPPTDTAFAALRPDVFVFGTPDSVRRGIEGATSFETRNPEARSWMTRRPASLFSMWVNAEAVTRAAFATPANAATQGTSKVTPRGLRTDSFDNYGGDANSNSTDAPVAATSQDPFRKTLESIRRFYTSFGSDDDSMDVLFVAQMRTPDDARELNDMLTSFQKMFAPSTTQARTPQSDLLDRLRLTTANDEVQLQMQISGAEYAAFVRDADKRYAARTTTTTAKPRTRRAPRRR